MNTIYFEKSWYKVASTLGDKSPILVNAIIEYQFDGTVPADDEVYPFFLLIKERIDEHSARKIQAKTRRAERTAEEPKRTKLVHRDTAEKEEPKKKFVKPTLKEVADYCVKNNLNVDAEKFRSYYESNGWKVGRNPMKNWQLTADRWHKNVLERNGGRNAFQSVDMMTPKQAQDYADAMADPNPKWLTEIESNDTDI